MIEVLIAIFGVSGTIVTAIFTYKLGLRNSKIAELKASQDALKVEKEAQKDELSNVDEGMRMWRELSERLEEKLKKSETVNELYIELKQQYSEILAQNSTLLKKIDHLESELLKLTSR